MSRYILVVAISLLSCKNSIQSIENCAGHVDNTTYQKTTLEELRQNPSKYLNANIETEGYLSAEFENVGIYAHKDYKNDETVYRLWLNFNPELLKNESKIEKLHLQKISLKGTFNPLKKGHLNGFHGEVDNVVCIRKIP